MPGSGNARESATERKLPARAQEKLKGCGKSAPGRGQPSPQGKPHPEQNQIGTTSWRVASSLSGLVARDLW